MASDNRFSFLKDDYEKAAACGKLIKKPTGIIFNDEMSLHKCTWNANHSERPERYLGVLDRLVELKLLDRCKQLKYEAVAVSTITKLHTPELCKKLEHVSASNVNEMENEAANYDAIYFNAETYNAAMISLSCAVQLVKEVCLGTVQNGFAIIRPPGHHAMTNDYCGYCYFNNVAVAAQYALDNKLANKILIVDYDVHHGQGTQQMFYDSSNVLYFSIHRYEYGKFWPNLRESDYDYVGQGKGEGFNVNVPLNTIGLGDADYMSIVLHILIPLAYEYNPDLVIVSAGYDACIGCFEGEMNVSPGFYGHLITLLSGLAEGKLAVCLEGGYFIPSLAEGAAMTLKALLGDPTATLLPLSLPDETTITTINNLKLILRNYWKCFKIFPIFDSTVVKDCHEAFIEYFGIPLVAPFETRTDYPLQGTYDFEKNTGIIKNFKNAYEKLSTKLPVCVCFDSLMLLHSSNNSRHFEMPQRLETTYNQYKLWQLDERCLNLEAMPTTAAVIQNTHSESYVNQILNDEFSSLCHSLQDIFYDGNTKMVVLKAVECVLTTVDSVMKGESSSGAALIRPPGHHAQKDKPAGFCYLNNVAIAAQYLLDKYKVDRILIVDFDIHHGNGTQSAFYENKEVLYMSIHKYNNGEYFPNSSEASCKYSGSGKGEGYNVNIAVNGDSLCNIDYITIFHRIILPIAYSFLPKVILVSAGFDAGINDPLGNYKLTPDCFGHFIQLLKPLANGKIILVLEGGYNITTLKFGMNICIKTLLGDPLPLLDLVPDTVKVSTINCIDQVIAVHKLYWPIFEIDKKLSSLSLKITN